MKYRIQIDGQVFEVEITDLTSRPVVAVVNGEPVEVWPEDAESSHPPTPSERPAAAAARNVPAPTQPAALASGSSTNKVYAPIPGVIAAVTVQAGTQVVFGQELCVLEAMKMKNAIRATRAGKIAAVHVAVGQQVKHHDLLMEYTD